MKINLSDIFGITTLILVLFLAIVAIQLVINTYFLEGAIISLLCLTYISKSRLFRQEKEIKKLNNKNKNLKALIKDNSDHLESIEKKFNEIGNRINFHIKKDFGELLKLIESETWKKWRELTDKKEEKKMIFRIVGLCKKCIERIKLGHPVIVDIKNEYGELLNFVCEHYKGE